MLAREGYDHKELIKDLIEELWDLDYDNICESDWYTNPTVRECLLDLDPKYKEYFKEENK